MIAIAMVVAAVIIGAGIDLTISRFQPSGSVIISNQTSSSTTSASGIRLEESVNASSIIGFQRLNISVSLFNTRSSVNPIHTANDWFFTGVPVSLWGACYQGAPVNMLILRGNYSLDQLRAGQNMTFASSGCYGGGGTTQQVTFQPDSDIANITGEYIVGTAPHQTLGPYRLGLSYTTDGSWDSASLETQEQAYVPDIQAGGQFAPVYTAFFAGVYTIAVADEWGQAVILHLTVLPNTGVTSTSTSTSCSGYPPGGDCIALYSYTFAIFVNYTGRWMVNYTGYNSGGLPAPILVNGTYTGVGPYSKSVTLTGYNNQFLTLCATAQKLDPGNAILVLTVTGSNETSAQYGSVTYCGGVAP